jgi:hypothetical protein
MPVMPRIKGKAEKIAYKILGVPANLREKTKTAKSGKISKKLYYEDTRLVR